MTVLSGNFLGMIFFIQIVALVLLKINLISRSFSFAVTSYIIKEKRAPYQVEQNCLFFCQINYCGIKLSVFQRFVKRRVRTIKLLSLAQRDFFFFIRIFLHFLDGHSRLHKWHKVVTFTTNVLPDIKGYT